MRRLALGSLLVATVGGAGYATYQVSAPRSVPLVTGKFISPGETAAEVGSFPARMVLSPNGKYIVATNTGYRQQLSVLAAADGSLVSRVEFNQGTRPNKRGLYFGLAFGPDGKLYASRGSEDRISVFTLGADGKLLPDRELLDTKPAATADPEAPAARTAAAIPHFTAGFDFEGGGVVLARNITHEGTDLKGELARIDLATGKSTLFARVGGYPLDVAVVNGKVFSTSERDGVVDIIQRTAQGNGRGTRTKALKTGRNPSYFLKSPEGLYVSNSGSDSVSLIDPANERVVRTIMVRPAEYRGLPSCTPLGMAIDATNLYVALADLNAVAVIDRKRGTVRGYLPAGWYPTSVIATGGKLYVANAKGSQLRNPNGKPVADRGTYIQNIIEGTVSRYDLARALPDLKASTAQVFANNGLGTGRMERIARGFKNPGIKHVVYIVKENRTYDNILGDLPGGNGDPSLCLFPREVTPNQHALAERFGILDNFHCCAEVSADGWNWSTSGMISQHVARNAPYNYSGRGRSYDYEGDNQGTAADLKGLPDVAESAGGYIWDAALRAKVTVRNYGMFVGNVGGSADQEGTEAPAAFTPKKRALIGLTDESFPQYNLTIADSQAYEKHGLKPPQMVATFGKFGSTSRFAEWKREFDGYVKSGSMPGLTLLRLPRDHTSGSAAGRSSARSMVADNDYSVGQVVEAISRSPFWKSTVICVLEDDAQAGIDHVDAHRSIAFVVSPWNKRGAKDSRFYNTDSMLRTIELLLGIKPMNGYDAMADPIDVFARTMENPEPYTAILPSKEILGEVNTRTTYRSGDSERLISQVQEESLADVELNDILWRTIKGTPIPARLRK